MKTQNFSTINNIPIYLQIAEIFKLQIESSELLVGSKLSTERDISEQLGVNRQTIRQAMSVLESQGLIIRKQGIGTFVAQPKIEHPTSQFFWFTRQMKITGRTPGAKIISFERCTADKVTSRELRIAFSSPVYHCFRLRFVNQSPFSLENFYLPADKFPSMEKHDLNTRSLYDVMNIEYGVNVARLKFTLETFPANEFEAKYLNIGKGAPVFIERRVTEDQTGRIIEFAKDTYRGDQIIFTSDWLKADF